MNRRVELFRPFQGAILLVHLNISRSKHVVRIQALNVQLNIVTWSSLVHSLMMHLHSEHFLSVRIQNRVRWQEYDFFAWLHKAALETALVHLVGLERMGNFQLLCASCVLIRSPRLAPQLRTSPPWASHQSPWYSGNPL